MQKLDDIRFGAALNVVPEMYINADWQGVKKIALECEELGFDSIWTMDHFTWYDGGPAVLECWTTLSAIAAVTKKIRIGPLVLCNSYRYPPVLAKMAATLDVTSNGRLIFGIGAGWKEDEYIAYGIPFPKPSVRIAQLREAVKIIKMMWTEKKPSLQGRYYQIKELDFGPKLVQKPHPPIMIGGGGERLTLKIVAEYADICNFPSPATPDICRRKLEALRKHCITIGRDYDEIIKSVNLELFIGRSKDEVQEKLARARTSSMTRFSGTPDEIVEVIKEYKDLGFTYFILHQSSMNSEDRRLFVEEVMLRIS